MTTLAGLALCAAPAQAQVEIVLPPVEVPITIGGPVADVQLSNVDVGRIDDLGFLVGFEPYPATGMGERFDLQTRIRNAGPAPADRALLRIALPDGVKLHGRGATTVTENLGLTKFPEAECRMDESVAQLVVCFFEAPLPVGVAGRVFVPLIADRTGVDVPIPANARSESIPDPLPQNNDAETSVTVSSQPDTKVEALPDGARGTAAQLGFAPPAGDRVEDVMRSVSPYGGQTMLDRLGDLARVEVAVLKRQPNRRRCVWLASTRPKFKSSRAGTGGRCTDGRWLSVRGIDRWRFQLQRTWPPGTYTIYSRAVNQGGARETTFGTRDGNRVTFTVKR